MRPALLFLGIAVLAAAATASPTEEAIKAAVAKMLGNMTVAQKARQLVYASGVTHLLRLRCPCTRAVHGYWYM